MGGRTGSRLFWAVIHWGVLGALFGVCFRSFLVLFFVLLFCSFLDRFGVPFWDHFGSQNRSKCGLAIFDFLLFFLRFFNDFGVLEGPMFVSFRFFFRFVFGIDF